MADTACDVCHRVEASQEQPLLRLTGADVHPVQQNNEKATSVNTNAPVKLQSEWATIPCQSQAKRRASPRSVVNEREANERSPPINHGPGA